MTDHLETLSGLIILLATIKLFAIVCLDINLKVALWNGGPWVAEGQRKIYNVSFWSWVILESSGIYFEILVLLSTLRLIRSIL